MYRLPDPAIEAILKEWDPQEYDPPNTNIREWIRAIESLCDTYGIPDTQRPQCATRFVKGELRPQLENVLEDARAQFGPVLWAQFASFMVALDQKFQAWEELPLYKKYPTQLVGAALFLTGTALLAPVAIAGALTAAGFTSTGVAAYSVAATVQSIVYGGATGGLFSLLQSAGATMVLPSVGTIVAGVATTRAGIEMIGNGELITNKILLNSIAYSSQPRSVGGSEANSHGYLLTPRALQAIAKSWNIAPYSPLGTNVPQWLEELQGFCELYGVPVTQRPLCVMHHMGTDREAAHAAGCHDMMRDQFTTWLLKYDVSAKRKSYLFLLFLALLSICEIFMLIR